MSSGKQLIKDLPILVDGVMTGTNVLLSSEVDVSGMEKVFVNLAWTGTPNGTFVIQVPASFSAANPRIVSAWATLPVLNTSGTALTATGSASNHQVDVTQVSFSRIRVQYTNSSSTGTLNAWITAKGV